MLNFHPCTASLMKIFHGEISQTMVDSADSAVEVIAFILVIIIHCSRGCKLISFVSNSKQQLHK